MARRLHALAFAVTVLLCAGLAVAGTHRRGGAAHATKVRPRLAVQLFYANFLSAEELQFYAFPGGTRVGAEYDVADPQGWVGRVKVTRVDVVDSGCPNLVYPLATARFESPPERRAGGAVMAVFSAGARPARRARLMLTEEVRPLPPDVRQLPDVGLDLDGDRQADVVRFSYECAAAAGGPYPSYAWCIDTWVRERSAWTAVEKASFSDCY